MSPGGTGPGTGAPVVVVGAGLSGLSCAARLHASGRPVLVLDKGRGVGGRMATRRIGPAVVDHGAQFFTVRSDEFAALVQRWAEDGVARVWHRGLVAPGAGPDATPDGHERWCGTGGMTTIAKALAAGIDVRDGVLVFAVRPAPAGAPHRWVVVLDDATEVAASAVVLTAPAPQSLSLAITAEVHLPRVLWETDYDRTLGVLAVLDGPSGVPAPGAVLDGDSTFSFVADNATKGISPVPALTLHVRAAESAARWDDDPKVTLAALLTAARPFLGGAHVVQAQLKRWRYATSRATGTDLYLPVGDGTLVLAGDGIAGPSVERAVLSGWAAADHLLGRE